MSDYDGVPGSKCGAIDLPHVALARSNGKGGFQSFGFASKSGLLAVSIELLGKDHANAYGSNVSGEWGIDFVIHVPTGFALFRFTDSPSIDDAMLLLDDLDGIPGWERSNWREIAADTETRDAVLAARKAWGRR